MLYVKTCTSCLKVSWVTGKDIPICQCMAPYIVETSGERDSRLGITKMDIRTFLVDDELKGTEYEQEKGGSRKKWDISTREMIAICANTNS